MVGLSSQKGEQVMNKIKTILNKIKTHKKGLLIGIATLVTGVTVVALKKRHDTDECDCLNGDYDSVENDCCCSVEETAEQV